MTKQPQAAQHRPEPPHPKRREERGLRTDGVSRSTKRTSTNYCLKILLQERQLQWIRVRKGQHWRMFSGLIVKCQLTNQKIQQILKLLKELKLALKTYLML